MQCLANNISLLRYDLKLSLFIFYLACLKIMYTRVSVLDISYT